MPSYRLFFLLERREKDQDSMAKQLTAHAFLLDAKEKKTSESKKKCGGGEVKSPEKHLAKHLEKHLETQLLMLCPGRDFLGNRGREGELPIRAAHPSHSREAGAKIFDFHPSFPPVCRFGFRG